MNKKDQSTFHGIFQMWIVIDLLYLGLIVTTILKKPSQSAE